MEKQLTLSNQHKKLCLGQIQYNTLLSPTLHIFKHNAKSTLELLTKKTVNVPKWPSYSFDLNLLESLWQAVVILACKSWWGKLPKIFVDACQQSHYTTQQNTTLNNTLIAL